MTVKGMGGNHRDPSATIGKDHDCVLVSGSDRRWMIHERW